MIMPVQSVAFTLALAAAHQTPSGPIPGDIVYLGLVDQTWQVFVGESTTSAIHQVTFDAGDKQWPTWLPDGSISFHTADQRAYRIESLDSRPKPLFEEKWPVREVTISPASGTIVFTRARTDGEDQSNLWASDGFGGEPRLLTRDQGLQCQASWAPDGKRLVYLGSIAWNDNDLRVLELGGEQILRLTTDRVWKFCPAWSPDGSRIAYSSAVSGDYEIWAVDPDGTHSQRLTDSTGDDTKPCWSPDSRRVLFSSLRSGHWELWHVDAVGGDARRFDTIPGPCREASWRSTYRPASPSVAAGILPAAVTAVSAAPKTMRIGAGNAVKISFELHVPAAVSVDIIDEHGAVVARRDLGDRPAGSMEVSWDGLDEQGTPAIDGVYRYAIVTRDQSGSTQVYDPSSGFTASEFNPERFTFDKDTGLLTWVMPRAGLVRLRAALDPSPHLRTMLEWVPMEPGEQSYLWDGTDSSGLIRVKEHPRCLVTLTLLTVAPNTVFVANSTSQGGLTVNRVTEYSPTYDRPGQSPFANIPPEHRHDPRFHVEFVGFTEQAETPVRVRGTVPVRTTLAQEDARYFQTHQFEAAFFVDLHLLFEDEEATTPFTFLWDTSGLDPGEHLLTVVLYGYMGQTGVLTRRVLVEK